VVLATGHAMDHAVEEMMAGGVRRFLQKPFNLRQVSEALFKALRDDDTENVNTRERVSTAIIMHLDEEDLQNRFLGLCRDVAGLLSALGSDCDDPQRRELMQATSERLFSMLSADAAKPFTREYRHDIANVLSGAHYLLQAANPQDIQSEDTDNLEIVSGTLNFALNILAELRRRAQAEV